MLKNKGYVKTYSKIPIQSHIFPNEATSRRRRGFPKNENLKHIRDLWIWGQYVYSKWFYRAWNC
jgi:hypothetical protein